MFSINDTRLLGKSLSISKERKRKIFFNENLLKILSSAGRVHFFYFVSIIFFGSFYLVNLILAIVSMSYLEQQKQIQLENKQNQIRKIEDELQLKTEENYSIDQHVRYSLQQRSFFGKSLINFDRNFSMINQE